MSERYEGGRPGLGRREVLTIAAASAAAWAVLPTSSAQGASESKTMVDPASIKGILFDVQGTTVDFYATILRKGDVFTRAHGIEADWTRIADQWRTEYRRLLDQIIAGTIPWRSTDQIYREGLDTLLATYDWGPKLSAADRDQLNAVWSQLEPWPDTRPGLDRLAKKFTISTLSNGSMASVVSIAKLGQLPFDCILTAELVKSSKPDPKVYALGQNALALKPEQLLMVACHKYDLAGAKKFGFNTAFIPRPLEFGPKGKVDLTPEPYFDLMANDFVDLAGKLGA
ncbi:haloacid dehalogenase type II [Methylobacterium brachythecii]|uniref:(S)-2-haloacid dehalogenase n=1 Tax=Methylobacterium brachythecii TaxID=1176177 RepID=A0A7W6F5Y3_9HYPH|nr:haloacid dehalogenase type II [Methylobacterium brachythecii]MBB3901386.1 2-haloacid dehalogenase [Methylobacterium brachythecii]GLS42961.1 dehalogenase [Methylobacterium brachythecii]